MKTPADPFTIDVHQATAMVKHIAGPRHSTWVRPRPYLAQKLICVGHGLVQSGLMTVFVVARLCYMIARICSGAVRGIRLVHDVSIRWLEFVFITIPLFAMGLCFLLATIVFTWGIVAALYRGFLHIPRP